jgi:hypothetical protein
MTCRITKNYSYAILLRTNDIIYGIDEGSEMSYYTSTHNVKILPYDVKHFSKKEKAYAKGRLS